MSSLEKVNSHHVFLDTIRTNLENDYETELPPELIDGVCKIFELVIQEESGSKQKTRFETYVKKQTSKTFISALRWVETERLGKYDSSNPISIQPATQPPLKDLVSKSVEDQLVPSRQLSGGRYYTKVNYNEKVKIGNQSLWLEGKNLTFERIGGSQPPKSTIWIAEKTTGDRYVWRSSKQVDRTDLEKLFRFLLAERTVRTQFPSIHVNAGTHGNESGEGAHEKGDKRLTDKRIKKEARQALTLACQALGMPGNFVYDKFSIHQVSSYSPNIYPREADHIIDPQCKGANSMVPKTYAGLEEDLMFLYNPNSNIPEISPSSMLPRLQSSSSKVLDPATSLAHSSLDKSPESTANHLFDAALKGDIEAIKSLLEKNPQLIHCVDSKGYTPLHWAAQGGHVEAIKFLLARNPQLIDKITNSGYAPLHWAAQQGHLEAVKFLLEKAPGFIYTVNNSGFTPLHLAAYAGHIEVGKYLLSKDPDLLNLKSKDGKTPLALASDKGFQSWISSINDLLNLKPDDLWKKASQGHIEEMRFLLERNPQLIEITTDGWTLLHITAQHGQTEATKFLLEKDPKLIDKPGPSGYIPLHLAIQNGHTETVKLLVTQKPQLIASVDSNGYNLLHWAAQQGHVEVVKFLLEKEPNLVYRFNNNGYAPFHLAAYCGQTEVGKYLLSKKPDLLNMKSKSGKTALAYSTDSGKKDFQIWISSVGGK